MHHPYAHLLPPDVPVWERYLDLHKDTYDLLEYDVRVGLGRDPGPDFPENIRNMALDLSLRRIDCVGHSRGLITVIEITTSAGFKAIGQVLSYPLLYTLTYTPNFPVRSLLVCETMQSDITPVIETLGIPYATV